MYRGETACLFCIVFHFVLADDVVLVPRTRYDVHITRPGKVLKLVPIPG